MRCDPLEPSHPPAEKHQTTHVHGAWSASLVHDAEILGSSAACALCFCVSVSELLCSWALGKSSDVWGVSYCHPPVVRTKSLLLVDHWVLGINWGTELLIVAGTTHSSVLQSNHKIKPDEPWKKHNGYNSYPEQIRNAQLSSAGRGGFIAADAVDQLRQSHVTGVATERGGEPACPEQPWRVPAGRGRV